MGNTSSHQHDHKLIFTRQYGYHQLHQQASPMYPIEAIKIYQLTSQQQQKSFKSLIAMYQCFNVPTILPITNSQSINNDNQIRYGWKLRFKYLGKNLQQEIEQRKKNGKKYSQDQVLKTLDCVLSALMGFHLKKLFHGNVNCQNVLIDYHPKRQIMREDMDSQRDGDWKIYVIGLPLLLNNEDIGQNLKNKRYEKSYLSPLALSQLMQGKIKPSTSQKSDVFALGLIILKMCSFCQISDIYDYTKMKIKKYILQKIIHECRTSYTEGFCNIMEKMLDPNQKLRLDLEGILKRIEILSVSNETGLKEEEVKKNDSGLLHRVTEKKSRDNRMECSPDRPTSNKKLSLTKNITMEPISRSHSRNRTDNQTSTLFPTILFSNTKKTEMDRTSYKRFKSNFVQAEQLKHAVFISKDNQKAWQKFSQRMDNKRKNINNKEERRYS